MKGFGLARDNPRRSNIIDIVHGAQKYEHHSDYSSVEDDKVDDGGGIDEDEEGDGND